MIRLYDHQVDAVYRIRNGNILCGGVGSGKSLAALAYYYIRNKGSIVDNEFASRMINPMDLYIITTAKKRDSLDWEKEALNIGIVKGKKDSLYDLNFVVDSWNNIEKYIGIKNAFFIFDEQRVIGSGAWVKSFYKITKNNEWILLSATPGDTWPDYIPIFIANGFYRTKTEFIDEHVVYNYHVPFRQILRYNGEAKLYRLRNQILVDMNFERNTVRHDIDEIVEYDRNLYKWIMVERKNPYEKIKINGKEFDKPIQNVSELCFLLRKVVNSDLSRLYRVKKIIENIDKVIIFYNFDFELELLRKIDYGEDYEVAEWNGHNHELIPKSDKWIYLVQYSSGCEGWNCIETNQMIFYSENYSYRIMEQAHGKIDRNNTKFVDLYYYHIRSTSNIDLAIHRAIKNKKNFNVSAFVKRN